MFSSCNEVYSEKPNPSISKTSSPIYSKLIILEAILSNVIALNKLEQWAVSPLEKSFANTVKSLEATLDLGGP